MKKAWLVSQRQNVWSESILRISHMRKLVRFQVHCWTTVYTGTYNFLELLTTWSKSSIHKSTCSELWELDVSERLLLKNDVNVSSFSWGTTTMGRQCAWSWSTVRSVKQLTVVVTVCTVLRKQFKRHTKNNKPWWSLKRQKCWTKSKETAYFYYMPLIILSILIQFNPHIWISFSS